MKDPEFFMNMDQEYISTINAYLDFRIRSANSDSSGNLQNVNVLTEDYFREFFNILWDCDLINVNALYQNTPGIDLLDQNKRIAVQVSGTCTRKKIETSISNYTKISTRPLRFIFAAIKKTAPRFNSPFDVPEGWSFSPDKDILDYNKIKTAVMHAGIEKLHRLHALTQLYSCRDIVGDGLLVPLINARKQHPSFELIGDDSLDKKLFPNTSLESSESSRTIIAPFGTSDSGRIAPLWDIIKAEQHFNFQHIIIDGAGGIGKSVSLLSITDDIEYLRGIPAIYIHMYDLVADGKCIGITEYIYQNFPGLADDIFMLSSKPGKPKIMLLLDGLNETPISLQGKLAAVVKKWSSNNPGVQIIMASRPLMYLNLKDSLGENSLYITLAPLTKEHVVDHLKKRGIPLPNANSGLWDVLVFPLFLTIFSKTAKLPKESKAGYPLFLREPQGAGALILNFLQREMLREDSDEWALKCAFACEVMIPQMAYEMRSNNLFELTPDEAERLANKVSASINISDLPSHLIVIHQLYRQRNRSKRDLKGIDWTTFILDEVGVFATNKKNRKYYSFIHQSFRDYLAALHLVNRWETKKIIPKELKYLYGNPSQHLVLQRMENHRYSAVYMHRDDNINCFIAEIMTDSQFNLLWEHCRKKASLEKTIVDNLLKMSTVRRGHDYSGLNFSGMDLRHVHLAEYATKDQQLNFFTDPKNANQTRLSISSFCQKYSPSKGILCLHKIDSNRFSCGLEDGSIRIWNINTGHCLNVLLGHIDPVSCLSVTPSGHLVSGSWDKTIRIWDTNTGECLQTLRGHVNAISCLAMTIDGNIVSGSLDNTIRIWETGSGKCLRVLFGHMARINALAVSPDGALISASDDYTLRIWNLVSGTCTKILKGHTNRIRCVAISKNMSIVSGSDDNTLRIWSASSGKCIRVLKGLSKWVSCLIVTPSNQIVNGSWPHKLLIWSCRLGICLRVLNRHTSWITCLALASDGRIVSGSQDNTIRFWNPKTGKQTNVLHVFEVNLSKLDLSNSLVKKRDVMSLRFNGAKVPIS